MKTRLEAKTQMKHEDVDELILCQSRALRGGGAGEGGGADEERAD